MKRARAIGLAALLFLSGCDEAVVPTLSPAPTPVPTPSPPSAGLRIANAGPNAVRNLTVFFPDSQTAYGDVAAGASTTHRTVPGGVYRYAAYRFDIDGEMVTQPVIDWVGETPMKGGAFTYTIDVDFRRPRLQTIYLLGVTRDD